MQVCLTLACVLLVTTLVVMHHLMVRLLLPQASLQFPMIIATPMNIGCRVSSLVMTALMVKTARNTIQTALLVVLASL